MVPDRKVLQGKQNTSKMLSIITIKILHTLCLPNLLMKW